MRNASYDHHNPFQVFALSVTTAYQEYRCYNSLACIKVQDDTSSYQFTCYATNRKNIWLPCMLYELEEHAYECYSWIWFKRHLVFHLVKDKQSKV